LPDQGSAGLNLKVLISSMLTNYNFDTLPSSGFSLPPIIKSKDDKVIPNVANACVTTAQEFSGAFRLNEMTGRIEVMRPLPSPITGLPMHFDGARAIMDEDYTSVSAALSRSHNVGFSLPQVQQAISSLARESSFHPIKDWLAGLDHDGTKRLDTWMIDYLGADDTPYTRGIGRLFLIGMVARVMRPGCKFDYTLILEGEQGIRKSTACKVLAGEKFFSDSLPPIREGSKDLASHLAGRWLVEVAEMSAASRADTEALKAFLTRTHETYRPAYGRNEITQPRQCVLVGTTNRTEYLRDATGDRRFWPVRCGMNGKPCNIDGLERVRDLLFAEAYLAFLDGETWWPSWEFEAEHIQTEQAQRFDCDPWEEMIQAHVQTSQSDRLTVAGLLTQVIDKKAPARADSSRVKAILQRLGYVEKRSNGVRYYTKAD